MRRVRVLLSPRWLALHLLAAVLVAVFLRLGWWQWQRAGEGSPRSLAYALEWPAFAAFVVLIWGYLVRDALRAAGPPKTVEPAGQEPAAPASHVESALLPPDPGLLAARERAAAEEADEDLAAYNAYLARLHAADARRRS